MAKDFKVWCQTDDELADVLTRASRDGFTWASGHSLLDYKFYEIEAPVGIIAYKGHIYYAQLWADFKEYHTAGMTEFSVQEYVQNGCPADMHESDEIVLKRGGLLEALKRVIASDDNLRELLRDAQPIVTFTGILITKLEQELFDNNEPDNNLYS